MRTALEYHEYTFAMISFHVRKKNFDFFSLSYVLLGEFNVKLFSTLVY